MAALVAHVSLAAAAPAFQQANNNTITSSPAIPNDFEEGAVAVHNLDKRDKGSREVWYCEHANNGGACKKQQFKNGWCYNFAPWWNDRISSIFMEKWTHCWLWVEGDCRGKNVLIKDPGVKDLKTKDMNDRASSIKCSSSNGSF